MSARPPAGRAGLPAVRQVGILSKINGGFWVHKTLDISFLL